jgi:hypothetical protein
MTDIHERLEKAFDCHVIADLVEEKKLKAALFANMLAPKMPALEHERIEFSRAYVP